MHQPRSHGFTLIELLVVASIISLLSSTVLASLNSARIKADQARGARVLEEYTKTLRLIYDDTGDYPPGSWLSSYCLGSYSDNKCGENNGSSNDTAFNNAFKKYLSSLPTFTPIQTSQKLYEGPVYTCGSVDINGKCIAAWITYWVPAAQPCYPSSPSVTGAVYAWDTEVRVCSFSITLQN